MERALATSRDPRTQSDGKRRIRLMIVDDSIVARAVLSRMIESDDAFEIVATAANGEDAIAALSTVHVDTIILDLESHVAQSPLVGHGGRCQVRPYCQIRAPYTLDTVILIRTRWAATMTARYSAQSGCSPAAAR